jgi:transcriptional regulator with XRE-family HTH domain
MAKAAPAPKVVTTIRHARLDAKLSMLELAAQSGNSLGAVQRMETCTDHDYMDTVSLGKLTSIAYVLERSATDLYPRLGLKEQDD